MEFGVEVVDVRRMLSCIVAQAEVLIWCVRDRERTILRNSKGKALICNEAGSR